jgi:Kef-type K+ transport system membrane component KefB
MLLGFFFMTVGFSIDPILIWKELPIIATMLVGLIATKAAIITLLSLLFGIPFISAQHAGLLNSSGGEFAFVAFGISERLGLLPTVLTKRLLTTVALSMAATPALDVLGGKISSFLEKRESYTDVAGDDKDSSALEMSNG